MLPFVLGRVLTPAALLPVGAGVALFAVIALRGRDGTQGQSDRWYVLQSSGVAFWTFLPLLISLLVGIGVAADSRGVLTLVRSRGVRVRTWLLATATVGAVAAAAMAAAAVLAGVLVVWLFSPAHGTSINTALPPAFGATPVPVAILAATAGGGAAMALVVMAVGVWSGNAFVTAALPLLVNLGASSSLSVDQQWLNPSSNMSLAESPLITPASVALYWAALAALSIVAITVWGRRTAA